MTTDPWIVEPDDTRRTARLLDRHPVDEVNLVLVWLIQSPDILASCLRGETQWVDGTTRRLGARAIEARWATVLEVAQAWDAEDRPRDKRLHR